MLGSAWDGVNEFFEKGVNWLQGEGFRTDSQVEDIQASQRYWEIIENLKSKYPTMGEQALKNHALYWGTNENGTIDLLPRELHAMGERSEGLSIAVLAALQQFDNQLALDTVIAKLEKEGYFKDTSNIKGGVVVEYNRDGSVKSIVELSVDGTQKTKYIWDGPVTAMEQYNVIEGKAIRSYGEVECMGTKIVSVYDSTGERAFQQATYILNENTNMYELEFVDRWLVDNTGAVIKDYKQYGETIGNIEMNPNYAQGVDNANNTFRKSGCLLTALANIFDFYGDEDYNTPSKIDEYVDKNKLWLDGTAGINPKRLVEFSGDYLFKSSKIEDNFNKVIQENLKSNIPTIVHYRIGHFSMVAGARYDAMGNITDYLMHDPGTAQSSGAYLSIRTLYSYRWNSQIDKLYWIIRNQQR